MNLLVYFLCLPALLVIAVTAMVRANDIGWAHKLDWHWHVRRLGLVIVGGAATAFTLSPFWPTGNPLMFHLCGGAMLWGFTLAWITTPGMPPWWKYITKGHA
jgi:hypothetical protein